MTATGHAPDGRADALQLLRPDGTLDPDFPLSVEVSPERCLVLHRAMVLARRFDAEAWNLQRQGELGLWLSSLGQEAAQVGSILAVRPDDHVFPAYREQAAALTRGLTPAQLLAPWRGATHGGWDPNEHRFHIYSLVLATQTLHATGYAMGVRADGADEVVLAYVGDGATSQGDANEAFNWAAVTGAPVVFFCQNNQWAISTPVSAQTATPLHHRARGFGLSGHCVDGNDVLAVHAVTSAAVANVRAGGAPAFVEATTYRRSGHSTADDPRRYRDDAQVAEWEQRDPVLRLETLLRAENWWDDAYGARLAEEADDLAAETRRACVALPPPALEDTFLNTLVCETPMLRAEREAYTVYRESFL